MQLLVLKPVIVARTNGAEISMIERLRIFQSWGVDVQVHIALPKSDRDGVIKLLEGLGTPVRNNSYRVDGVACFLHFDPRFHAENISAQFAMEDYFGTIIQRKKPDLIWAHYTDFFAVSAALQWNPEKTWVNITDNLFPDQIKLNAIPSLGGSYLKLKHVTVASEFMKRNVKSRLPWADCTVLPPPIALLNESPAARSPQEWVFVNPIEVKGLPFATELAKKLPEEKFLFVGNWVGYIPKGLPDNVRFIPRQASLRSVLARAKGLLVPSVWDEAFGRVVIEAMHCGVPVVASNRGALSETVSGGGLCLPLEVNRWVDVLRSPNSYWDDLIERGFERARDYLKYRTEFYLKFQEIFRTSHRLPMTSLESIRKL